MSIRYLHLYLGLPERLFLFVDYIETAKYFINRGLRISIFNISDFDISKTFLRENTGTNGIIINADCKGLSKLLIGVRTVALIIFSIPNPIFLVRQNGAKLQFQTLLACHKSIYEVLSHV